MCFDALAMKVIKEQCRENRKISRVSTGFDPAKPGSEKTANYQHTRKPSEEQGKCHE